LGKLADIEKRFNAVQQQRKIADNSAAVIQRSPTAIFRRRDTNEDGFLTLKEYIGDPTNRNIPALTKMFTQRDANNDGRLTIKEMNNQK
jgi:hypothetical protein